jgi:exosome complex component RRP45
MFKYSVEAPTSESQLIRKCLLEGTRLDGRKLGDFRRVKLTLDRIGATQSNAEVQIVGNNLLQGIAPEGIMEGGSRALCVVKGQVVAPFIDRPGEGFLNFSVDTTQLSPLCKVSDVELTRLLERSIKDSDAIDCESLCLISGEQVWAITCAVKLLDSGGGNIIDVCIMAAMAALRAFRKPEVSIETVGMGIVTERPVMRTIFDSNHADVSYPLPLHHTVVPITVGFFKINESLLNHENPDTHFQSAVRKSGGLLFPDSLSSSSSSSGGSSGGAGSGAGQPNSGLAVVVDPSMEEMRAMDGYITFCINAHMEICSIYKPGFVAVPHTVIMSCIKFISTQINNLHQQLSLQVSLLDEADIVKKNQKTDALRQYNYMKSLVEQSNSNSNSNSNTRNISHVVPGVHMGVDAMDESSSGNKAISRDDPMLAWDNLHQPAESL